MNINITITDEQGAAIAQAFHIPSYIDGSDLARQAAEAAMLQYNKQRVIKEIAISSDAAVVEAVIAAYNAIAASPITPPPIRLK